MSLQRNGKQVEASSSPRSEYLIEQYKTHFIAMVSRWKHPRQKVLNVIRTLWKKNYMWNQVLTFSNYKLLDIDAPKQETMSVPIPFLFYNHICYLKWFTSLLFGFLYFHFGAVMTVGSSCLHWLWVYKYIEYWDDRVLLLLD